MVCVWMDIVPLISDTDNLCVSVCVSLCLSLPSHSYLPTSPEKYAWSLIGFIALLKALALLFSIFCFISFCSNLYYFLSSTSLVLICSFSSFLR